MEGYVKSIVQMSSKSGDPCQGYRHVNLYSPQICSAPRCLLHMQALHYPHLTCLMHCCCSCPLGQCFCAPDKGVNPLIAHWNPIQVWKGAWLRLWWHWHKDNIGVWFVVHCIETFNFQISSSLARSYIEDTTWPLAWGNSCSCPDWLCCMCQEWIMQAHIFRNHSLAKCSFRQCNHAIIHNLILAWISLLVQTITYLEL